MRGVSQTITEVIATTQLTLEVAVDDLDQHQLRQQLAELYRKTVEIDVVSGSAIVRISAVLSGASQSASQSSFITRASQIGDEELSRILGVPVRAVPWSMDFVNVSIPYDKECEAGYCEMIRNRPYATKTSHVHVVLQMPAPGMMSRVGQCDGQRVGDEGQ